MKTGKNSNLTRVILLSVIFTATFGAGLADMLTDVVPFRPYTGVFHFTPVEVIGRSSSIMADLLIVTLVVVLVASLLAAVANRTTGLVISHSGFTPNTNLTSTSGLSSVIPLFPLFFSFLGLVAVAKYLKRETGGGI